MDTLVGGIRSGSFGHQSWWAVSGRVFFAVPPLAFTVTTLEDTLGFKVGGGQVSQSGCIAGERKPLVFGQSKNLGTANWLIGCCIHRWNRGLTNPTSVGFWKKSSRQDSLCPSQLRRNAGGTLVTRGAHKVFKCRKDT